MSRRERETLSKGKAVKMSVHGSRSLGDERVRIIILEEIEKNKVDLIVTHGEPGGVCEMARQICKEKAIPLLLHFLNFKYLRGAFERRSKAVLEDSDVGLFIHDGESRGTQNEMILAKKMNVRAITHMVKPEEHKKSVGFPIEEEWGDG